MVRLAISVEGQTEEIFMKKVIVPYLRELEIYATPFLLGQTGGDVFMFVGHGEPGARSDQPP